MNYRELLKILERDGWRIERVVGSHQQRLAFEQDAAVASRAGHEAEVGDALGFGSEGDQVVRHGWLVGR